MSSKYIAGVLRSKAWETMKETLMEKKDKVGEKLVPAIGGQGGAYLSRLFLQE